MLSYACRERHITNKSPYPNGIFWEPQPQVYLYLFLGSGGQKTEKLERAECAARVRVIRRYGEWE